MGLFDKDRFLTLFDFRDGDLVFPPHNSWESDYGRSRVDGLRDGTALMLRQFQERKNEPFLSARKMAKYADRFPKTIAEVSSYIRRNPQVMGKLAMATQYIYGAIDMVAEKRPSSNPFREFDTESLCSTPEYLLGKPEAFGWSFAVGHLFALVERDLGWDQPRGRVDRRTWAALIGFACLDARRTANTEPLDLSPGHQLSDDQLARGAVAGQFLIVSERAIVGGYREGR